MTNPAIANRDTRTLRAMMNKPALPPAPAKTVPPGHVRIRAPFTSDELTLLLDEDPPKPSGDIGGWQSIVVPRRRAVRYWSSTPEAGLEINVILQDINGSIDGQIGLLTSMGSAVESGKERRRPRRVELDGQLPELPLKRWVIDDVTWGDAIYEGLKPVRQHLTIKFGEPPDDKIVKVGAGGRSKFRTGKGKKKSKSTAKLLAGETLQEFAARVLGNPSRWREIAALQKPRIKDPRKPGKPGRALRLPKS